MIGSTLLLVLAALAVVQCYVQRGPSRSPQHRPATRLYSEFRLLIQGTKNAYTTIRVNDVLLYVNSKGNSGLGVYKEGKIFPLCNYDKGSSAFFVDYAVQAPDADELKAASKLLRVVSSDRRGQNCFIIEEFISSDVEIPIRLESDNTPEIAMLAKGPTTDSPLPTGSTIARGKLVRVSSPVAPKALGPYSQAICCNGFIFLSGCLGIKVEAPGVQGLVDGIEAQTLQALNNMKSIIKQARKDNAIVGDDSSTDLRICKTTILLSDINNFAAVNKVYEDFFRTHTSEGEDGDVIFPARTTYQVAALPLRALVEVEAVAAIDRAITITI